MDNGALNVRRSRFRDPPHTFGPSDNADYTVYVQRTNMLA